MIDDTSTSRVAAQDADTDETRRLISSSKVEGTNVYNLEGEHVGSVNSFMVDKHSGKVSYAVMSFGGFLGIGERYHPLPWGALKYDTNAGGYIVNITREQLEGGPSFARDEDPWTDPEYGRRVHSHYGLPYSM
ncbi:PRC-barrel domain-containing protein [Roseinatronobacter sp. S2]|uniref:PRC-barrel domain-containing protein n=1 Tax=Roseinatronobacter sp. S2 TaxID=3035471 RepID=UPI00240FB918|nr:PRC-barrel domain-containing protein [Roseinatronobacter sp. S2]WFE76557.1 PRC-barrel domain-containing protein [Roseinatronobacter sp. S2]